MKKPCIHGESDADTALPKMPRNLGGRAGFIRDKLYSAYLWGKTYQAQGKSHSPPHV
jgi:hypothetical protein